MNSENNKKYLKRHSIRLKNYDYTQTGMYFVTICVQDWIQLFVDIADGAMKLNDVGRMVEKIWREIPEYYSNVDIDEYIIMPNHMHGIIVLMNDDGHPQ